MNINNQHEYWDQVADRKTFTHPLDLSLLEQIVDKESFIVDYGCGYGRIVHQMQQAGYQNILGFDSSSKLVERGLNAFPALQLKHIQEYTDLPFYDASVDCILLFAVLTCIPSNASQTGLINHLYTKLKTGACLYISDYYLQPRSIVVKEYGTLGDDPANFGVFHLEEGVSFRHHTREWISSLLKDFKILKQIEIEVMTMNGNKASAFQMIVQK